LKYSAFTLYSTWITCCWSSSRSKRKFNGSGSASPVFHGHARGPPLCSDPVEPNPREARSGRAAGIPKQPFQPPAQLARKLASDRIAEAPEPGALRRNPSSSSTSASELVCPSVRHVQPDVVPWQRRIGSDDKFNLLAGPAEIRISYLLEWSVVASMLCPDRYSTGPRAKFKSPRATGSGPVKIINRRTHVNVPQQIDAPMSAHTQFASASNFRVRPIPSSIGR